MLEWCMEMNIKIECSSDTRPAGRYGSRGGDARSMSDMDMFSTVSRLDEEDEDSEFFDLSDEEGKDDTVDTR